MRYLLPALLAAFLAAPVVFAADRPVGPETGQVRDRNDDQGRNNPREPDTFPTFEGTIPREILGGGGNRGQRWDWCPWWFCR